MIDDANLEHCDVVGTSDTITALHDARFRRIRELRSAVVVSVDTAYPQRFIRKVPIPSSSNDGVNQPNSRGTPLDSIHPVLSTDTVRVVVVKEIQNSRARSVGPRR